MQISPQLKVRNFSEEKFRLRGNMREDFVWKVKRLKHKTMSLKW